MFLFSCIGGSGVAASPKKYLGAQWRRRVLCWVLCAFFWSGVALPSAVAQDVAPPATETETETPAPENVISTAPVEVNGRVLFDVIGADGADAARRASIINRRLEHLIEREEEVERFQPGDIFGDGAEQTVMLGGEKVVTVTQADVQYELLPASELAQRWGTLAYRAVRNARYARTGTLSNITILTLTSLYDLVRSVITWLPRLLGALVLAFVFWGLARLTRWIARRATYSKRLDPNLRQLAIAVTFYGVWAMGLLAILSALGIDSASIATTVGVSGFVLGFAFKDVLAHFFAGLMLLMGRQFSIGGEIVVGEFEGTVESIDLRALQLRTYDNRLVTIPNGDVFNSAVIANTHNLHRRREFTVGISYNDDPRKAIGLVLRAVRGVSGVLVEPEPQVLAAGFGASSINLRVLFHTSTVNIDPGVVLSECIIRVKEKFESEGITIPPNIYTLDVRHAEGIGEALAPMLNASQLSGRSVLPEEKE